jgi:hypothetical protein
MRSLASSASTHCWAARSLSCLLGEKLDTFACFRRESGELVRLEKAVGVDCSKLPEHLRAARIVEGLRELVVALAKPTE